MHWESLRHISHSSSYSGSQLAWWPWIGTIQAGHQIEFNLFIFLPRWKEVLFNAIFLFGRMVLLVYVSINMRLFVPSLLSSTSITEHSRYSCFCYFTCYFVVISVVQDLKIILFTKIDELIFQFKIQAKIVDWLINWLFFFNIWAMKWRRLIKEIVMP